MKKWLFVTTSFLLAVSPVHAQDGDGDPMARDAAEVAKIKNITPVEAQRRLGLQQKIAELEARLATDPAFGGLSIQSTSSTFRVNVKFTGDPAARIAQLVTDPELKSVVQGSVATVALGQLQQAQAKLLDLFQTLHQDTGIRIDQDAGQIVGLVRNPSIIKAAVDALGLGGLVRLEQETRFPAPVIDLRGGESVATNRGNCTSAFGVRRSSTTGILSGGHCVQSAPGGSFAGTTMQQQGVTLNTQNALWDATRDFAWAAGSGHVGTNKVYDGQGVRSITSTFSGAPSRGAMVCKYGRATGYTCQEVTNPSYAGTDANGNRVGPIVELGGTSANIAQCGDSGGPLFNGGIAYGVTSRGDVNGRCAGGSKLYYVTISNVSGLGVLVLTN